MESSEAGNQQLYELTSRFVDVDLKNSPLFYYGCGKKVGERDCLKEVVDGFCRSCGQIDADAIRVCAMARVRILGGDVRIKVIAFRDNAEALLGVSGNKLFELDDEVMLNLDAERSFFRLLTKFGEDYFSIYALDS